ncbi:MAG: helix-turn-helix transcriptional regulator [Candidatus Omnitrophota bacterium]
MRQVNKHLEQKLKDPYFKELYELEEQKLNIVKRIIDYRVKNNLTQGQLAKKIGISQQHISKIENGEFSNIVTLEKILLAIGFKVKIEVAPLHKRIRDQILKMRPLKMHHQMA